MKKRIIITCVLLCSILTYSANTPILITENTITLNFEEEKELHFSFAAGDMISVDFEMVKGKHLKEFEVYESDQNKIFSEFKLQKLSKKQFHVKNMSVYRFKFYSTSITKRVFKIKIFRTPSSEATVNFNTNWKWETIRDTIYVLYTVDSIAGYNTIKYKEKVRELVHTEVKEDLWVNKTQRVHSYWNGNGNKTYVKVTFPNPVNTPLKEEKTISWAYWIGVGEEAQKAYRQNEIQLADAAINLTSYADPLAGLALGVITKLITPSNGHDVHYAFLPNDLAVQNYLNNQPYQYFDQGKGIAAYGKNSDRNTGTFYIGLYNDNQTIGIDVTIKIVLLKEIKTFQIVEYDKEREEPIIVTLNKTRMEIKETKIRVPEE